MFGRCQGCWSWRLSDRIQQAQQKERELLSKSEHRPRPLLGDWLGVTSLERSVELSQEFTLSPIGTWQMERLGRGETPMGLVCLADFSGRDVESERREERGGRLKWP